MSQKKVQKELRVAIVQQGKIIEERVFEKRREISVGSRARNTFHVEGEVPESLSLFTVEGGGYSLTLTDQMQGKLSLDGNVYLLDELTALTRRVGKVSWAGKECDTYSMPLKETVRGKIELGENTVLFQFVEPRIKPQAAPVTRMLRGARGWGFDRAYAAIILLSFVAHSGAIYLLHQQGPLPKKHTVEQLLKDPPRLTPLEIRVAPKIRPAPVVKPEPRKVPKASERPKSTKPKTADEPRRTRRSPKPTGTQRSKARAQGKSKDVGNIGLLGLFKQKATQQVLNNKSGVAIGRALKQSKAVASAQPGLRWTRKTVGTPGRIGLNARPGISTGGELKAPSAARGRTGARVDGGFKMYTHPKIGIPFDQDALAALIRKHRWQIDYCYNRVLKRNPDVQGKLVMKMKIAKSGNGGRARSIVFVQDTLGHAGVKACLKRFVAKWDFPRPKATASVSLPLVFVGGR